MSQLLHIALLIETSREYGRGILRGIARYHLEYGPWSIYFEPHELRGRPPFWLKDWRGDGILARIDNRQLADVILSTGLPAVDVRGVLPDSPIPFVGSDDRAIAQVGFEHLRDCGLKNFAYIGLLRGENQNLDRRCDAFVELVRTANKQCDVFHENRTRRKSISWELEQQQVGEWLKNLPKPVGVMACQDDRGHQVLDACRRAGLRVPDEVAVIGSGNDANVCSLCSPPLTSIDLNPSRVGYEAASLLMRLMKGDPPPEGPVLVGPPRGIVRRQSTDLLAIEDEDVAEALRFIRDHATEGIGASDVIANARQAPSTLSQRIKSFLGRSLASEITRVRLERAKLLLKETDLPVGTIAIRSGFSELKYFCDVFQKNERTTPSAYRKPFRS